jgi:8-oxo-dGTP pyrophosphatase MutT (NUDIX family)
MQERAAVSVTFVIEFDAQFLLVSRSGALGNFPNLWAFPGGKVEVGETLIEAVMRESYEETGLRLKNEGAFLDSYWFGRTVGAAFLVFAKSGKVRLSPELTAHQWVKDESDLRTLSCIPGIYNHLVRAKEVIRRQEVVDLRPLNLTPGKYINQG